MTNMQPLDLALAAQCIGQPVQAIADDAVNPRDAGGFKGFGSRTGAADLLTRNF